MHWVSQDRKTERKLSFEHFSRQSHRIAVLLKDKLGVQTGEKLLVVLPRVPEWWEIATAAFRSGIVLCPATSLLVDKDIEYRIRRSAASVFVGDSVSVQKVLRVRANCPSLKHIIQVGGRSPKDVIHFSTALGSIPQTATYTGPRPPVSKAALIYFTSGTTGNPKMVQHNHISYPLAHTITGKHWLRLKPGQLYWNLSEQGWAKAAWSFLGAWNCGAGLFVHDDREAFRAAQTLDILHSYPITTFCAPPTAYRQLVLGEMRAVLESQRPKSLVHCAGAGEPLNPEVIRLFKESSGLEICDGYGQTETVLVCGNFEGWEIRPGSMGRPSPGVPLCVVDENGIESPEGVEGDIALRVDVSASSGEAFFGVFDGYLGENGELDRKLIDCPSSSANDQTNPHKWYLTGDRASRDKEGYFWFVGRSDDVINSSGYRIGPFEVESTLKQHPAVVESAVVSSPEKSRGEVVKAFVVLTKEAVVDAGSQQEGALAKELQDFCKEHAAPYKYPRKIQFVDAAWLGQYKTISGKTQRKRLKELEWRGERESKAKL